MFDLETLGSNSSAPIVQLSAVEFDLSGRCLREFDKRVDLSKGGWFKHFTTDVETIEWWLRQSEIARTRVFGDHDRVNLFACLTSFNQFVEQESGAKKFWSHATFDPPVLANAYLKTSLPCPIAFRDFVDIRTIKFLAGEVDTSPRESFGEAHDALADCKYQASYVAAMLRKLGDHSIRKLFIPANLGPEQAEP